MLSLPVNLALVCDNAKIAFQPAAPPTGKPTKVSSLILHSITKLFDESMTFLDTYLRSVEKDVQIAIIALLNSVAH